MISKVARKKANKVLMTDELETGDGALEIREEQLGLENDTKSNKKSTKSAFKPVFTFGSTHGDVLG